MEIIIRDRESDLRKLKGKHISDLARNLESEGWPSEFRSEEERDKVKYLEKRLERPVTKEDIPKLEGM